MGSPETRPHRADSLERGIQVSPLLWLSAGEGEYVFWGVGERDCAQREGGKSSLGFGPAVAEAWTVPLPDYVADPLEVYVNGVPQRPGTDYAVRGRVLEFTKPLAQEGRLGFIRWASIFLGIAGTYRKHDSVDVIYELGGRRQVAAGLPVVPPDD